MMFPAHVGMNRCLPGSLFAYIHVPCTGVWIETHNFMIQVRSPKSIMIPSLKEVYAFIPDQIDKPVFLGQAA